MERTAARHRPTLPLRAAAGHLRSIEPTRLLAVGVASAVIGLAGCSEPMSELAQLPSAPPNLTGSSPMVTFDYQGGVQTWKVPTGVTSLEITALGGQGGTAGGTSGDSVLGWGASVTGTVAVQPGQTLQVSVGGNGGAALQHSTAVGGWGGLGAHGGAGKAEKDYLRSSGGGGGATTIQLTDTNGQNPQTILIAGGGGGMGGQGGGPNAGEGGNAGCGAAYTVHGTSYPFGPPTWSGSDGTAGSPPLEGKGGRAAAGPGMTGAGGIGGTGLGADGGGGGGGLLGGAAGTGAKGTSPGGGGGAGSSVTYTMTNTAVTCAPHLSNVPAVVFTVANEPAVTE